MGGPRRTVRPAQRSENGPWAGGVGLKVREVCAVWCVGLAAKSLMRAVHVRRGELAPIEQ